MTTTAMIALLVAAVIVGVVAQFIGEHRRNWEWLAAGVAALVGGYLAGQYIGPATSLGWQWEGLWIVPALIGAVVLAAIVDFVVRQTAPEAV